MPEWYEYTETNTFEKGNDAGVDLATPFHTPLYFPYGGRVTKADYGDWAGDIKVAVQGLSGVSEEFIHSDLQFVSVGDQIQPGQIVSLSGGQLSGGFHPVHNSPGHFYSSAPHVEFDWNVGGQYVDPEPILQQMRAVHQKGGQLPGDILGAFSGFDPFGGAGLLIENAAQGAGKDWIAGVLKGSLGLFGFKGFSDFSQRVLLGLLGLVLLIAGIFVISLWLSARAVKSVGGVTGAVGLGKAVSG